MLRFYPITKNVFGSVEVFLQILFAVSVFFMLKTAKYKTQSI